MMKLFNLWDVESIKFQEKALSKYIYVTPVLVPRSGGRAASGQRIWVQKNNIVERLMNKLMVPGHRGKKHKATSGHCTGKSNNVYKIVKEVFQKIEKDTKQNPVQVFVTAVENASPREEVTSIEYGGARYSKAVDLSPLRRTDLALRWMVQGAYTKSFNSKKKIGTALVEEIMAAYKLDTASNAISKKLELERQADSSR
jgi:small subunit ribosomal protein S7